VRVGDIDLHVEERGDGDPLLLIAGIPRATCSSSSSPSRHAR
jgi:hypothetical protein